MSKTNLMTNDDILEAITQKPVLELVELIKMIEERFGVSASAMPAMMPAAAHGAPAQAAAVAEEKTSFKLSLKTVGANKVGVIKAIRAKSTLGLKEAKDLIEGALPVCLKEDTSKAEAEEWKKLLDEAGAEAVIE